MFVTCGDLDYHNDDTNYLYKNLCFLTQEYNRLSLNIKIKNKNYNTLDKLKKDNIHLLELRPAICNKEYYVYIYNLITEEQQIIKNYSLFKYLILLGYPILDSVQYQDLYVFFSILYFLEDKEEKDCNIDRIINNILLVLNDISNEQVKAFDMSQLNREKLGKIIFNYICDIDILNYGMFSKDGYIYFRHSNIFSLNNFVFNSIENFFNIINDTYKDCIEYGSINININYKMSNIRVFSIKDNGDIIDKINSIIALHKLKEA